MNPAQIQSLVISELTQIAPEIEFPDIDMNANIQDEYDLDSMDLLTLIVALNEKTGVEIPEADYGSMKTLQDLVDYFKERV